MGRERIGVDRSRRVVGGANALEGEDGRVGALLEPGGCCVCPLVRLGADVPPLEPPERERHDHRRDRAGDQGKWKSEANRHLAVCSASAAGDFSTG